MKIAGWKFELRTTEMDGELSIDHDDRFDNQKLREGSKTSQLWIGLLYPVFEFCSIRPDTTTLQPDIFK